MKKLLDHSLSFSNHVKSVSLLIVLILFYSAITQAQSSDPFSLQNQTIFKIFQNSQANLSPQSTTVNHESNTLPWENIQTIVIDQPVGPNIFAKPVSLNLDQVRNGSGTDPVVPPLVAPWVNGNAGSSNAHYAEGWSIPYRCVFENLPNGSHSVDIEWDARQSNSSAIDFVTNFDMLDYPSGSHVNSFGHIKEVINPIVEAGTWSSGTSSVIPTPGFPGGAPPAVLPYYSAIMAVTFPGDPAKDANKFSIWNANIDNMVYVVPEGNVTVAASSTRLRIYFTNTAPTVVISWGGHIAKGPGVWGENNSASAVSGSPYHTRLIEWDDDGVGPHIPTSVGNQDRSLSADAVLDPPTCLLGGPTSLECSSTGTYTSGVSASDLGPGVTYEWSVFSTTCGTNSVTLSNQSVGSVTASVSGCSCNFVLRFKLLKNGVELSHCDKPVTVSDTRAPEFTSCPSGSDLGCNPASIPVGSPTATDACTTPTITSSLGAESGTSCSRSRTRIYTATDACGNSSTCQQVFTYTVDNTGPQFTFCPPGSNLGCNPTSFASPGAATATDACGTPSITSSLGAEVGTSCSRSRTRTYVATDACGNSSTCQQVFTYTVDITAPQFTFCPPGSNLGCNPTTFAAPGAATATDACGTPSITSSLGAEVGTSCSRSRTRTYVATDACGNSSTCQQVFTYTVDNTAPVFTFCPPGSNVGCNPTTFAAPGAATATDACGTPSITSSLGAEVGTSCSRSRTRTYVATDACGNSSTCQQVFTYTVDVTPPVFTACQPDVTVECGSPTSTATLGSATATDGCGSTTVTANDGAPIPVGCQTVIVRTWTARDACGNTATCVQRILVVDRIAPVITCNADGSATATDCSSYYLYQNGTKWTAIDASGNISTATCTPTGRIAPTQITAEQKEQSNTSVTEEKTKAAVSAKPILQNITVQTLPNPFNDKVKFIVTAPEAGYATLDVMNMLGQKVKTVFQGRIPAGGQSFEMVLPKSRSTTLFYILKMNGKQVTGKLVQMN